MMIRWLAVFLLMSWGALAQQAVKPAQTFPTPPIATACCTLTTGGTAQNFQNATSTAPNATQSPVSCFIVNPATATEQNIAAAEVIWYNLFGDAVAAAGGTSVPIEAGQNIVLYPSTKPISWTAATAGHKITGYCWQ